MARHAGLDLTITATTDRRAGLADCDAVLTSFRPGGFEARYLDESIPLKHGVIGQETQGPGGFFMALRSIHVMQGIVADMEAVCPRARLFNYTNPINIVSEAMTHHTAIPTVSLCEGPIIFPRGLAARRRPRPRQGGRGDDRAQSRLLDACATATTAQDMIPLVRDAYARKRDDPDGRPSTTCACWNWPARWAALPPRTSSTTTSRTRCWPSCRPSRPRARRTSWPSVPDYWAHYREQAESDVPELDPQRSRGGIHELELAIDVMDAIYNDRKEVWPVNVPNHGAIADFPDDLVVEVPGYVDSNGVAPLAQGHLPRQVVGLVKMLGEYQALAAEAGWSGTRREAIQALASNPLVFSLHKAEAIYDEMAAAHKDYLPARLLQL